MNNFASGCRRPLGIAGRWALSLNKNVYTICSQVPGILRKVWGRECKSLKMGRRTMKCHHLGKTNSNHELGTAADACFGADLDRSRVGWGWRSSSQGPYLSLKNYLLLIDLGRKGGIALNCTLTHDLPGHQRRVLILSWRWPWSNEMGRERQLSQVSGKVTGSDGGMIDRVGRGISKARKEKNDWKTLYGCIKLPKKKLINK